MSAPVEEALAAARRHRADGRSADAEAGYVRAAELARSSGENALLAHALRHVTDLARERGEVALALDAAREAVALYRGPGTGSALDLANALRLAALATPAEADARLLWTEARALYSEAGVLVGVADADRHLAARADLP
jgi:hypothetical protein